MCIRDSSGGEAQRVKLSSELQKRSTGGTVYVLDEPTTGLHFEDVRRLLTVLSRLVDQGNTVLVIEHNLDVIKTADYLIDLGPEGGSGGGLIVAEGTPEHVASVAASHTGRFLKPLLGTDELPSIAVEETALPWENRPATKAAAKRDRQAAKVAKQTEQMLFGDDSGQGDDRNGDAAGVDAPPAKAAKTAGKAPTKAATKALGKPATRPRTKTKALRS